jgi:hypothetical protein
MRRRRRKRKQGAMALSISLSRSLRGDASAAIFLVPNQIEDHLNELHLR